MADWKNAFRRAAYAHQLEKFHLWALCRLQPNYKGAVAPGSFTSPLLDLASLDQIKRYDGEDLWEFIDLRRDRQRAYYEELLTKIPILNFPAAASDDYAYFTRNEWFAASDAFTLAGIMQKERPRKIVEVGSGFSSAAMLDVCRHLNLPTNLTFIDPLPLRFAQLVDRARRLSATLIESKVQDVPLALFEGLDAGDILFIDSSHVAKIGSDVTWIFLRILPRLKAGVIVHFHDIFFPCTYPDEWIRKGQAWNESIVLRAFLIGDPHFVILAFNSYAARTFPEVFREHMPAFLSNEGGSLWLRKREP